MRLRLDGSQLTGFASALAGVALALGEAKVPMPDATEVGHRRLADAVDDFDTTAGIGVARLAQAAKALSDWMLLAAEVAEAGHVRVGVAGALVAVAEGAIHRGDVHDQAISGGKAGRALEDRGELSDLGIRDPVASGDGLPV